MITVAIGENNLASFLCQLVNPGLPLMVPAAFMDAAWAAQPDSLSAAVGKIGRQLAQVEGWVPHALDKLVVRVRQQFLPLVIEPYTCITQASPRPVWHARVQVYITRRYTFRGYTPFYHGNHNQQ